MEQNNNLQEENKSAVPVEMPTEVPKAVPVVDEQKNLKMFAYGLAGILVVALVGSAAFGIYRVYAKADTSGYGATIAKVMRLPAMKVNGQTILFSEYSDDIKAIEKLVAFDKANGGANAALTDEQMSDQVLWRLANNVLVKEAAGKFGVKVENQDVEALKANLLAQFKDLNEVEKQVQSRYGWTYAQYEEKVIKNYILQQKIAEKIQTDQSAREDSRNRATAILNEIKAGKDFAELAKQYGEDGTKETGGDLGWFGKGDMVPEFENAVYALKAGEITQELVETQYGYHVIKLDEKKSEKVKDEKGKMVNAEKVKARHILIKFPDPQTYLDDLAKKADIKLYLNVHNPFAELKK